MAGLSGPYRCGRISTSWLRLSLLRIISANFCTISGEFWARPSKAFLVNLSSLVSSTAETVGRAGAADQELDLTQGLSRTKDRQDIDRTVLLGNGSLQGAGMDDTEKPAAVPLPEEGLSCLQGDPLAFREEVPQDSVAELPE